MTEVAVFGLGAMGFGVATSCLNAGFKTFGMDPNTKLTARFKNQGGELGDPKNVASTLGAVVIVVLNDLQTEEVLFGKNGIAQALKEGAVVISCATVSPKFARRMEEQCTELGILFLDAPISGGAAKAAKGALSVMASGSDSAFEAAEPVLNAMSETVFRLADKAGAGSAMKAVNQMLAGVHIAAMAEAVTFAISQGISPSRFLEVIPKCAGTSWMLENRAPHIAQGDYTPLSQVKIWPKDLGIVLDIAEQSGFEAPITQTALQQFKAAVAMGLENEDDAAVAKIYARQAGLNLPEITE